MSDALKGTRVALRHDVDRYPHFIAAAGMRGTVTEWGAELCAVHMDEHLPGAETWDNEVCWYPCNGDEPMRDVVILTEEDPAMKEADEVRETYRNDPTVSNEEYGRMVEDADKADEAREWTLEREPFDVDAHTWDNEHEPDCPIVHERASLLSALRADPTNPYLQGAVPEYDGGGDQEAEGCTCAPRGWVVYEQGPTGEFVVGYTVSPFASVYEWARDVGVDPAGLRVEPVRKPEPAKPIDADPAIVPVLTTLAAMAAERRAECLAFVTRRWSGGIETYPFPPLAVLEAIYETHDSELWESAGADEHEAYDQDMAAAAAYDEAAEVIREAFNRKG